MSKPRVNLADSFLTRYGLPYIATQLSASLSSDHIQVIAPPFFLALTNEFCCAHIHSIYCHRALSLKISSAVMPIKSIRLGRQLICKDHCLSFLSFLHSPPSFCLYSSFTWCFRSSFAGIAVSLRAMKRSCPVANLSLTKELLSFEGARVTDCQKLLLLQSCIHTRVPGHGTAAVTVSMAAPTVVKR